MIQISMPSLREAAEQRPPGYLEEVIKSGRIENEVLFLEPLIYIKLRKKYSPQIKPNILSNAASAAGRLAVAALKGKRITVSPKEQSRRLAICQGCEFFKNGRCLKCGCFTNLKTRLATEHCPISKW